MDKQLWLSVVLLEMGGLEMEVNEDLHLWRASEYGFIYVTIYADALPVTQIQLLPYYPVDDDGGLYVDLFMGIGEELVHETEVEVALGFDNTVDDAERVKDAIQAWWDANEEELKSKLVAKAKEMNDV